MAEVGDASFRNISKAVHNTKSGTYLQKLNSHKHTITPFFKSYQKQ